MKIKDASALRLLDFSTDLLGHSVLDYSQVKLGELTLENLNYLLRQRRWLSPLIKIVIEKIELHWLEIQKYYPPNSPAMEFFENAVVDLILLPQKYWDIDPESFSRLKAILIHNRAREVRVAPFILDDFMSYVPKCMVWDDEALELFTQYFFSHHGDVLIAENMIIDLIQAVLNGQNILITNQATPLEIRTIEDFRLLLLPQLPDHYDLDYRIRGEKPLHYSHPQVLTIPPTEASNEFQIDPIVWYDDDPDPSDA